jgi:hypothetical protein
MDTNIVKLGRKPPIYDSRRLRLERYLPARLPPIKPSVMYSNVVPKWGMMLNGTYGDCTIAGWGHLHLLRTSLCGKPAVMTDDAVLSLYSAVTSLEGAEFEPAGPDGTPPAQNDNGCVETDVLNYLRQQGDIGAYASVRPLSNDAVKFTIDAFEGIYVGAEMPLNCSGQNIWDADPNNMTGEAAPGSWGGHCLIAVDYDADGVTFVTWGMTQRATWRWWNAYINESYAILSVDLVNGATVAPSGFNLTQLQADLAVVTA